jgi:hypothetical protein
MEVTDLTARSAFVAQLLFRLALLDACISLWPWSALVASSWATRLMGETHVLVRLRVRVGSGVGLS